MAKSNKKNATEVLAQAVMPGYETINCIIESDEGNVMKIWASKPGSSATEYRVISRDNVLVYKGGVGKQSQLIVKGEMVFAEFPSAIIEPEKNGFIKVITNDGEVMVRAELLQARGAVAKDDAPEALKEMKKLKPTDALKTARPKKEISEKAKQSAKKNLEAANKKNQEKSSKKKNRS